MAQTPRPAKRKRTDSAQATPKATKIALDASDAAKSSSQTVSLKKGKQTAVEAESVDGGVSVDRDLEELERIYDMLAEEYHDILNELPLEYQRTFRLVRELEEQQQTHTAELQSSLETIVASTLERSAAPSPARSTSTSDEPPQPSSSMRARLNKVSLLATAAVRAGEDKVGLAITLYEAIDRHIRRLDADLARYEDSLVIGLREGTQPSHDAPSAIRKSPPGPTTSLGAIALGEREAYDTVGSGSDSAGRAMRKKRTAEELEKEREWKRRRELLKQERAQKRKAESGMPVDPNEPTYCYCSRVSFGEMIACENDDCSREWFHLECVGLDQAPEGAWYCDDCVRDLNLDPRTFKPNSTR
ncbi:inhibitorof growth protein 4 [Rhodotorula toruloides]|uniref:Chromatin modification-related protein n=1 Tax=Rhodotorula toruloides TaxID=5286 RepID=A0A511KKF5_RHOTO|nr:inhibitorof growth protein 4 [Rhodotorula toruloides]